MSAVDYKVEADENIALAIEYPLGYKHLSASDLIALAQANATIALAEQQRIANLIKYAHLRTDVLGGEPPQPSLRRRFESMHAEIREGLGI